jgi:hypothetical protein
MDGTALTISSVKYGTVQPIRTGTIASSGSTFFDVQVTSSNCIIGPDVLATISISDPSFSMDSIMAYWDGNSWISVSTTFTEPYTITGTIPASALGGTPFVVGGSPLFVVPEYTLGVLMSIFVMFAAFAIHRMTNFRVKRL